MINHSANWQSIFGIHQRPEEYKLLVDLSEFWQVTVSKIEGCLLPHILTVKQFKRVSCSGGLRCALQMIQSGMDNMRRSSVDLSFSIDAHTMQTTCSLQNGPHLLPNLFGRKALFCSFYSGLFVSPLISHRSNCENIQLSPLIIYLQHNTWKLYAKNEHASDYCITNDMIGWH